MPAVAALAALVLLDVAFLSWWVTRKSERRSLVEHAARLGARARHRQ